MIAHPVGCRCPSCIEAWWGGYSGARTRILRALAFGLLAFALALVGAITSLVALSGVAR
jgi:hypothetical protein